MRRAGCMEGKKIAGGRRPRASWAAREGLRWGWDGMQSVLGRIADSSCTGYYVWKEMHRRAHLNPSTDGYVMATNSIAMDNPS
jgi:hypothetical protein